MTKSGNILIIEDDVDMVEAMKIPLSAKNYQVNVAFSPNEGFQMAKQENPDLIILDVMFGSKMNTDGFDCAVKMKRDKTLAPIPILMITAVNVQNPGFHFSPDTDGEYLPVDDFIDKPAQPEDLIQKVEKLLKMKISKWVNWPEKVGY
jgi:DNA-binding response OmpR family regulator